MSNREPMMLAQVFDSKKHSPCGFYASEKLDGIRAWWDGGISRGIPATQIPFANTEKHARFREARIATGLWSRYYQPISAPEWFLDLLPKGQILDGELHMDRGQWQKLTSVVKKLVPDEDEWQQVRYAVFDSPGLADLLQEGRINNTNFKKIITADIKEWFLARGYAVVPSLPTYAMLSNLDMPKTGRIYALEQAILPHNRESADNLIASMLDEIFAYGGEGLMIRDSMLCWTPKRVSSLLKIKAVHDMEGTVVSYTWGEKTDKGSKLLGLMGSLRLRLDSGVLLDLSGFTDAERIMTCADGVLAASLIGQENPGCPAALGCWNPMFPLGARVTFKYRELSDTGVPKDGRYWRKAD